jgi:hypothetical protein
VHWQLCLVSGKDLRQQTVLLGVALVTGSPEVKQYEWQKQVECNVEVAHVDVGTACENQGINDSGCSRYTADESGSSPRTVRKQQRHQCKSATGPARYEYSDSDQDYY